MDQKKQNIAIMLAIAGIVVGTVLIVWALATIPDMSSVGGGTT